MSTAEARPRHRRHAAAAVSTYSPPYAAIVVDANSGRILHAVNENALRHPASLTKVMTLYMLFEQLERGKLRLDSEIPISSYAAAKPPTKLGLRPGQSITVDNAIKAVVTRSANDIATAIGEAIGGDEATFSDMMTRKARSLGMTRTRFVNASGLPDPDQVTTATDLSILGRVIQERFPRYYGYFQTHTFYYGRQAIRNHNRLLGSVEGVDGIKTGYTRASGFNLLTSAKRDGHRIIGVVLGGKSGGARDRVMAGLVEDYIDSGSRTRSAPMIAERPVERDPAPVVVAALPPPRPEPVQAVLPPMRAETPAPRPVGLVTAAYAAEERPRPAVISSGTKFEERVATATIRSATPSVLDGSTSSRPVAAAAATPSNMRWISGPRGVETDARTKAAFVAPIKPNETKAETKVAKFTPPAAIPAAREAASRPVVASAKQGLMIQIGATDDQSKAQDLLSRAKAQGRSVLGAAQPFTEKVQRGKDTLWRARFAGLSEDGAEAACKTLKRSGFACFTTRN
ncbi:MULTISPECIES: serine hydrolase [unclassified Beijerinckia]|uniref:serine hydrolase n=1 Tax=unclassified Beijerinckia TaxID=2638183 RepID=UPI001FCCD85F|nr:MULTISPECIES: serine hydrolase [unclassified Beijerinckia]